MMRILVAHASRMGGTAEIAERIGTRLREAGFEVDVYACADVPEPTEYDAVIVGSALYTRHWERAARAYLEAWTDQLAERPTWLFHSGPCGEGAQDQPVTANRTIRRLARRIGASPPMTFGGRLDPTRATTRLQRWMTNGSEAGDWRDWDRVDAWAAGIADQLTARATPTHPRPHRS
jgi:menaquinone-dependent protoporphyrinogen oxidase